MSEEEVERMNRELHICSMCGVDNKGRAVPYCQPCDESRVCESCKKPLGERLGVQCLKCFTFFHG